MVLNTRLSLIAVMFFAGSGGVEFKVGLDDCVAFEVLIAYLDMIDKGGCLNILEVWHSKSILSGKICKE